MQDRVIIRHEEPNKNDTANYLTLCKCYKHGHNEFEYYIQLSKDSENPKWEYLGCQDTEEILFKLIDFLK